MAEWKSRVSDETLDAADLVFARRETDIHTGHVARTRYGDLTTLYADSTGRRIACRCRCTKMVSVNIGDLKSGAVTSCGCCRPSFEHRLQQREMSITRRRTIEFNIAKAR
jgi:hypothetical protein